MALKCGMNVVGVHRGNYPELARALQDELRAAGRRCELLVGDAGRMSTLHPLLDQVKAMVPPGQLRIFVHSLADASRGLIVHEDPAKRVHVKQILKTMEVMAHSFLVWGQELFEAGLLGEGSQLLALPNHAETVYVRGFAPIGVAKAALNAYVHYMALELAPHGIRVNGLRFGPTLTEGLRRMRPNDGDMAIWRNIAPTGQLTTTADVGDFVELMVDPRARWLTGSIIDLTGGWHLAIADSVLGPPRG